VAIASSASRRVASRRVERSTVSHAQHHGDQTARTTRIQVDLDANVRHVREDEAETDVEPATA
jgi:hypothetical protein